MPAPKNPHRYPPIMRQWLTQIEKDGTLDTSFKYENERQLVIMRHRISGFRNALRHYSEVTALPESRERYLTLYQLSLTIRTERIGEDRLTLRVFAETAWELEEHGAPSASASPAQPAPPAQPETEIKYDAAPHYRKTIVQALRTYYITRARIPEAQAVDQHSDKSDKVLSLLTLAIDGGYSPSLNVIEAKENLEQSLTDPDA